MNIASSFQPIHGAHHGLTLYHHDRLNELNERLQSRQFPDTQLRPNFDPRPTPTKYAHFPIIERRASAHVPITPVPAHNVETNFNPSTQKYHVSTYLANIDTELQLRNQTHTLSRNDQYVYVPSSTSDLYNTFLPTGSIGTGANPDHGLLFHRPALATNTPEFVRDGKVGVDTLFNHTRTQLRGMK